MGEDRWHQLQALFSEARAATLERREELLQERARDDPDLVERVRSLLRADERTGVMDDLAPRLVSVAGLLNDEVPHRIGPYRVVSELGRGGMGVVYLADRDDGQFQQRVAIKVGSAVAADPLHRRFLAERQILAGLVHPHIARLLDGGISDDGRPYLVMEYIEGEPITAYCDRHRLAVSARLGLFADVCAAVQHAHQKLVVHRDLKPTNILVSSHGRVHLLDFGIAKLLTGAPNESAPATRLDTHAMTPEYASPEQVRGESLTTASDIYSLGVLLYELLCGRRPYPVASSSPLELARLICEEDPAPPSARVSRDASDADDDTARAIAEARGASPDRLARQLNGDLDSIVLMAMRKEPSHRYASADMMRQDVQRHLSGLPVLAHRGNRRYRAGKFVRRHRVEVAAAGLVLVALLMGLTVSVEQSRRAKLERERAEHALAESEGVTNFLLELYRTGEGGESSPTQLSAMDLLDRGAARANELAGRPVVHARLLDVIGQMSFHLGRLDEAQQQLERAVAIRRATLGGRSLELAASLIHLARVHRERNDFEPARRLVSEALAIRRSVLPRSHPDIADALYELGWLSFGPEQERLYREGLEIMPDSGAVVERRLTILHALSTNLRRQGRLNEAVAVGREALRLAEQVLGPEHATTGHAMIHLADHVNDIEGDHAAAERLYRRGLALLEQRYGEKSTRLIHALHSLAHLLSARGDAEAETLYRRSLEIRISATGPDHAQVADEYQMLARELARQGRLTEAETLARQALELSVRTLGRRHPVVPNSRLPFLAEVLELQGRHSDADRTYRQAIGEAPFSGVVPGQMRRSYGILLLQRGEFALAEGQLLESLKLLEQAYGDPNHPNVHETRRALMQLYQRWGKPELVERYRVPPGRFVPY